MQAPPFGPLPAKKLPSFLVKDESIISRVTTFIHNTLTRIALAGTNCRSPAHCRSSFGSVPKAFCSFLVSSIPLHCNGCRRLLLPTALRLTPLQREAPRGIHECRPRASHQPAAFCGFCTITTCSFHRRYISVILCRKDRIVKRKIFKPPEAFF